MTLGGDPNRLRDLARDLRREADLVDAERIRVMASDGLSWQGPAGERYRDRLAEHGLGLHRTRDALAEAATEMGRHADILEERQRLIRIAQERVENAIQDARSTLGRYVGLAWDALTDREFGIVKTAQSFLGGIGDLPVPGAPEWQDVARRLGL